MEYLQELQHYVDLGVILIYLFAGMLAKKIDLFSKISTAYKTIILGTIFTTLYAYLMHLQGSDIVWAKIFFSYIFATSFYDRLLKWLFEKLGVNQPKEQANTTTDACECIENDYYEAREMSPSDLSALLTSGDHFEDFVYCEEMIYISTLDENHQPQIQSYFVGTRPPKKPVRI